MVAKNGVAMLSFDSETTSEVSRRFTDTFSWKRPARFPREIVAADIIDAFEDDV